MAQTESYREWVATRPANVRAVAERFEPDWVYSHRHAEGVYTLISFEEYHDSDRVTLKIQRWLPETGTPLWGVFGVNPDDLVPIGPATLGDDGLLRWAEPAQAN